MKRSLQSALVTAALLVTPLAANAQPTQTVFSYSGSGDATELVLNGTSIFSANARGHYLSDGSNNGFGSSNNFIAGVCGPVACEEEDHFYRNWFQFDLGGFTPIATSAVLRLYNNPEGFYNQLGSALGYNLFEITNSFDGLGGPSSVAYYDDLGDGAQFGGVTVTSADNGQTIEIALNAAALASINTKRQGEGMWAVGGAVDANVSTVPEPSTYALMFAGLAVVAGAARAKRRSA